jgi:hypothetical protein
MTGFQVRFEIYGDEEQERNIRGCSISKSNKVFAHYKIITSEVKETHDCCLFYTSEKPKNLQ